MPPKKNHIGEKHGTLEVIAEAPSRKSKSGNLLTCWKVRCSHCGCEKIMLWGSIRNAKSCGCIKVTDVPKECTCKRCGKSFTGNIFTVYCPECKEVIKELHGVKGIRVFLLKQSVLTAARILLQAQKKLSDALSVEKRPKEKAIVFVPRDEKTGRQEGLEKHTRVLTVGNLLS